MERRIVVCEVYGLVRAGLELLCNEIERCRVVAQAVGESDAQAVIAAEAPDVVLLDQSVLENEGTEVAGRLVAEFPVSRFIVVTPAPSAYLLRKLLEMHVHGVLTYQGAREELRMAIEGVCRDGSFISPYASHFLVNGFVRRAADRSGVGRRNIVFTPRQRDVLRLLAQGKVNKEIARELHISVKTVETHRARMMSTLGLQRGHELLQYAIRNGLDNYA